MPSISDLLGTEVKQSNEDLAHLINAPPTQLQIFGNSNNSLPKDPKSIGGQTDLERAEIDRELAQRKQDLPICRINEKKDDSEHENASVEKAESNIIYSKSIKSKEASVIEKGHDKREIAVFDFSEKPFCLPYEFHAKEIDEHQEQSDMAEQSVINDEHQEHKRAAEQSSLGNHSSDDTRSQEKDDDKALGSHPRTEQGIV